MWGRGMNCPRLVAGDGHPGIWGTMRNVYPEAAEQRRWNRKIMNVLGRLPKKRQGEAKVMLRAIYFPETRTRADRLRDDFAQWYRGNGDDTAPKPWSGTGSS